MNRNLNFKSEKHWALLIKVIFNRNFLTMQKNFGLMQVSKNATADPTNTLTSLLIAQSSK